MIKSTAEMLKEGISPFYPKVLFEEQMKKRKKVRQDTSTPSSSC